jgi:hypothetical protein
LASGRAIDLWFLDESPAAALVVGVFKHKKMYTNWDDILTFGTYKGYSLFEVVYLLECADYVVWLIEQTDKMLLGEEIENAIYLAKNDQYLALMFDDFQNTLQDVLHTRRTNVRKSIADETV